MYRTPHISTTAGVPPSRAGKGARGLGQRPMGKTGKIGRAVHYVPSIVKASRRPWRAAPLAALLLLTLSALIALVASCVAPVPREAPAPLAGRTAPTAIPMPPTPVGDQTVSGEPAEAVTSPDHAPATRPQTQIRALWVDAFHDGIKTPPQVDKLVADAQLAGINTLIVQVRRRGDAYYNRTTEPRTADPALSPGFDALQRTIERAHAAEPPLEVHAWIATVALWNERDRPPADPHHAFNRHGPHAPGAENWISLDDSGAAWDGSNYMLDPGHPGATRYVAEVAAELVREYDIDGIHLDLVRYASARWGYNPVSVARYNRRHGTTGQPAPTDLRWQQWRRDQVTALVRRVYLDSLAVKPRVKVSAATIGWGSGPVDERTWRETSAYGSVFQDWISWLDEGIVDVVMPMTYDDEGDPVQQAWFDQWTAWQRQRKGRRHVAVGIGLFLNDPAGGLAQIRRALEPAASGLRLDGVA
ncbi:MAG: glycoside hydrolase family 10 protein, partial [Chloroflexota bacterium]